MTTKTKRKPSKPEIILKLIRRPSGANLAALQKATGWQAHSVRAALTGLRKAGHEVERSRSAAGTTVYRATASDAG